MSDLEKKRKATYDIKILGWILGFVGKYRIYFALSFVLMIATAALEITVPYLIKTAVDNQIYPTWSKTESGQQTDQTLLGLGEEAMLALPTEGFWSISQNSPLQKKTESSARAFRSRR